MPPAFHLPRWFALTARRVARGAAWSAHDRWADRPCSRPRALDAGFRPTGADAAEALRTVRIHQAMWAPLGGAERRERVRDLQGRLALDGWQSASRLEALGCAADAAVRTLGLSPHAVQIEAAEALLAERFVELAGGEGKTLVLALAAAVTALGGVRVHALTASDRLAQRNAARFRPMFRDLGLTLGVVTAGSPQRLRRAAYRCDVVWAAAREVALDRLRDEQNPALPRTEFEVRAARLNGVLPPSPLLPGLSMALVDEADALLVDDAALSLELKDGGATGSTARGRIRLQRFFRGYDWLAAVGSTLAECRGELEAAYGRTLVVMPPRLAPQRATLRERVFRDAAHRLQALPPRVAALRRAGRPVLIGCATRPEAEAAEALLKQAGIDCGVQTAESEGCDAAVLEASGRAGAVTITVRPARRGVDVALDPAAARGGGLHVLNLEDNLSARADRQLAGLAARRGEPGSVEAWRTLDALRRVSPRVARLVERHGRCDAEGAYRLPAGLLALWRRHSQRHEARRVARHRARQREQDARHERRYRLPWTSPVPGEG